MEVEEREQQQPLVVARSGRFFLCRHCRNAKNKSACATSTSFPPGHAGRNVRVRSWVKCRFLHCGHLGSPERVFFGGFLAAALFPTGRLPLAAGFFTRAFPMPTAT